MVSTLIRQLTTIFNFDLRSLAITRIAFASLIIIDLIIRGTFLEAHYTDFGLLPRSALLDLGWNNWHISLHLISGNYYFQLLLFIVQGIFAFLLLVGYKTRLMSILCWVFMLSLHNRNRMLLQGGDVLFRMALFWGMFIPWGARYSIDSIRNRKESAVTNEVFSLGAFAFLVQISLMYVCTALLKSGDDWQKDYTAIYYSLSLEQLRVGLGYILYKFPEIMKALTFTTLWLELLTPILFFIPYKKDYFRTAGFLLIISLQFGIMLTLRVGLFPLISMSCMLILIPGFFWDRLPQLLSNERKLVLNNRIRAIIPKSYHTQKNNISRTPAYLNVIIIFFLCYVVAWNLTTLDVKSAKISRQIQWIAPLLRIDQKWNMFAPKPFRDDGWYVIPGRLRNGKVVDVFRDGKELSWEKPENIKADYKIYRWRKYMRNIWSRKNADYRLHYGRYLCRNWNRNHKLKDQLLTFDIYYMKETNLDNYMTAEVEKVHLWRHQCFKNLEISNSEN